MVNPKAQPTQTLQKRPSFFKSPVLPMLILVSCIALVGLDQAGYISLPHFALDVYEIPEQATIGKPASYDFYDEMLNLLEPNGPSNPAIYTCYLGSGVGFPPMGMILGTDCVLRGTPTGTGKNFEVCMKDVGGRSVCRKYHVTVNSENDDNDDVTPGTCPATSCDTGSCCGEAGSTVDGITPTTAGVLTRDYCDCPSDTYYSGVTDTQAAGGPWKICNCNGQ